MVTKILSISNKQEGYFGIRHVQTLFLFICSCLVFYMRVNISVGVVAMTNANTTNPDFQEFEWTEKEKSYVLSSFYWGCALTQFAGGYLSSQYGSKYLLLGCITGVSLLGLLNPIAVVYGDWQILCLCRFLQGFFQGPMFPSFYSHLARWAPVEERNKLAGIAQMGVDIGTVVGFASSGFISASDLGWPGIFYIPGVLGVIWSILWAFIGANSPAESKLISLAERERIEHSQNTDGNKPNGKKKVPWKSIFTSGPYLVLCFVKITQAFSFYTLMQQLPTYIHSVLKMGIKINSVLSAVPYMIMGTLSYAFLMSADLLIKRKCVSLTVLRKSINSIASFTPAIAFVALGYVREDDVVANMALLIVAVAASSAQAIGSSFNHIDLSPNHAGILYGLTNTFVAIIGFVAPLMVGLIISDETDRSQWRVVFLMIAIILVVGNVVFIIFGRTEVQPWNEEAENEEVQPKATDVRVEVANSRFSVNIVKDGNEKY